MSWINEHQRIWRAALLVLFLGSMLGPWVFDRINVPAEYPCHAPVVRLEGDFCGMPLTGMWVFFWIVGGLVTMVTRPVMETVVSANRAREILSVCLSLLPFAAPFSNILLLFSGGGHRRWRMFQVVVWGLGLGVALLAAVLPSYPRLMWELWGLWLYIGLAAGALALEALALAAGRTVGRG